MTAEKSYRPSILEEIRDELPGVWKSIPFKGVFVSFLVAWVLLFEFLGNSTFGYIESHSLFAWTFYSYYSSADDEHGFWIPLVVLVLLLFPFLPATISLLSCIWGSAHIKHLCRQKTSLYLKKWKK